MGTQNFYVLKVVWDFGIVTALSYSFISGRERPLECI